MLQLDLMWYCNEAEALSGCCNGRQNVNGTGRAEPEPESIFGLDPDDDAASPRPHSLWLGLYHVLFVDRPSHIFSSGLPSSGSHSTST